MKIVHATWEQRNLGVDTYEITLEQGDSEAVLEEISKINGDYLVVRVPVGSISLIAHLEKMGYHYIETMFDLKHDLKRIGTGITGVTKRMVDSLTYAPMNEADITQLFLQLKDSVFHTDRVYLDPAFTSEQAANRYMGWIQDELNRGAVLYNVLKKGTTVGFFITRIDEESVAHTLLSGLYRGYEGSGLGIGVNYLNTMSAQGAKYAVSGVSSNNIAAINTNVMVGWRLVGAKVIMVKHPHL